MKTNNKSTIIKTLLSELEVSEQRVSALMRQIEEQEKAFMSKLDQLEKAHMISLKRQEELFLTRLQTLLENDEMHLLIERLERLEQSLEKLKR